MANKKTTHGESKTQAKNNVQNPKRMRGNIREGKSSVEMNWKKGRAHRRCNRFSHGIPAEV